MRKVIVYEYVTWMASWSAREMAIPLLSSDVAEVSSQISEADAILLRGDL